MKRDPVLAQLDFLINGSTSKTPRGPEEEEEEKGGGVASMPALPPPPPPLLPPLHTPLPAPDPVLSQLDALINGAPAAVADNPVRQEPEEPRGPPGILREYGGVRGWMAMRSQQDDAYSTSPKRSTPTGTVDVCTNSPSLDHTTLLGSR